jgi:uncharacterized protein (DUF2147 family)
MKDMTGMLGMVTKLTLPAVLAVSLLAGGAGLAEAGNADALGIWRMENGKVTVKVSNCGGNLCGTVVALKKPVDDAGRPRHDKENPNPALRNRPVIGLTILSNMKAAGDNRWTGTIYNPDDGYTYSSKMKLQNGNTMKVDGCVAVFCKTMKFIRVQ